MNDAFTELFKDVIKGLRKYYLVFSLTILLLAFSSSFYPVLNIPLYIIVTVFLMGYLRYSTMHKKKIRLLLILHLTLLMFIGLQNSNTTISFYMSGVFLVVIYVESKISIVKSPDAIYKLLKSKFPESANKLVNFKIENVLVDKLVNGDVVVVNAGEIIPVDGVIESGTSSVDESGLTGDFIYKEKSPGSEVVAGSINKLTTIQIKIIKDPSLWLKNIILSLVSEKRPHAYLIDSFDKLYLPNMLVYIVVTIFVTLYVLLALDKIHLNSLWYSVISFPLGLYFIFIFSIEHFTKALSKEGYQINNFYSFLLSSATKSVVFGKSGILVDSVAEVLEMKTFDTKLQRYTLNSILEIVYVVVRKSKHDYSDAIIKYINNRVTSVDNEISLSEYKEVIGEGITCYADSIKVMIGNYKLCENNLIFVPIKVREFVEEIESYKGEAVFIVFNKEVVAVFAITNLSKSELSSTIDKIKEYGIKTVLITGDNQENAQKIFNRYKLEDYYYGVTPRDKAEKVSVIKQKYGNGITLAVGDSFSDIGALIEADLSLSLKSSAEIVQTVSSVILPTDSIERIEELINYGYFTRYSIMRNLWINLTAYPLIVFISTMLNIDSVFPLLYSLLTVPVAYLISLYTSNLIIKKQNLTAMNTALKS